MSHNPMVFRDEIQERYMQGRNTHTVMLLAMLVFLHLPLSGNGEMQIPAGVSLPPMPSLVPTSETVLAQQKRQDGIELMQLMSVSDGDAILHYSDWSFPTSIVVNAVRYLVETGLVNTFDIVLADNCHSNLADGYVGIKENEKEARIAAFAEMGVGQHRNHPVSQSLCVLVALDRTLAIGVDKSC